MKQYEREEMGNIVIIKGITFYNTITKKQELDHSWKNGRPCLIIYSDDEYDYFLTFTKTERTSEIYKKQYYPITEDEILYSYEYKNTINKKNRDKDIQGYINLGNVYKTPIYGKDEIKKVTFETYKEIIEGLKSFHKNQDLNEIMKTATTIRR